VPEAASAWREDAQRLGAGDENAGDDGWFRTGAVVSIDGRGSIRIRDRFRGAAVAEEDQLDGGRRRDASGPA
jgi:acyl-CoA synthetase (AMP-forming)/AMP-acid ligase II